MLRTVAKVLLFAALAAIAVCAFPAFEAWHSGDRNTWGIALKTMQTRGYYFAIFLATVFVSGFVGATIVAGLRHKMSDTAMQASERIFRISCLAILFMLMNGHVFLMAYMVYETNVPWDRYWEFFFSPYALSHTAIATAIWLWVSRGVVSRNRTKVA